VSIRGIRDNSIRYSDNIDGDAGNYGWRVQFDILGGYLGITQLAGGRTERVLLSPAQVRALLAFYDECAKQKEGGPGR